MKQRGSFPLHDFSFLSYLSFLIKFSDLWVIKMRACLTAWNESMKKTRELAMLQILYVT